MTAIRSLCVYCASSSTVAARYRLAARRLGGLLAQSGVEVVFGGGSVGLMGEVADGALAEGGRTIGIIPEHLKNREHYHTRTTELLVVDSMHSRKRAMVDRTDGFVIMPGGLGTLDETFEALTWRQLGLHDKPIVIVNVGGYWDLLIRLIENVIAEGFADRKAYGLYTVVEDVDRVLDAMARSPGSGILSAPELL